jgi:hypothetical protein
MISDGGGKRKAALRPMIGRGDVLALLQGLIWRGAVPLAGAVRLVRVNGAAGVLLEEGDDRVTIAFDPAPDERLAAIYVLRNPDKLAHVRSCRAPAPAQPLVLGVYQMGELQARSWMVEGTAVGTGRPLAIATKVLQRGVGISRTRA